MRPVQRVDTQSSKYVQWMLQENLNIHATNSAKLTKQILTLRQQLEQVQQSNTYYMQGLQTNTENLARITQMEKEKAFLIKSCDHFKAVMVKAQQAERAWNAWYLQQWSTKATVPMAPSSAYQGKDELFWAMSSGAAPAASATSVGGVLRPISAQPAVQSKPKAVVPKISI
eukprot:2853713-Amphidinium_carterae.1